MTEDVERMLFCSVCGEPACFGFGVTVEGVRMGDFGDWCCESHHPHRKARYTREEWTAARAKGKLYPDPLSPEGEWQKLSDIVAGMPKIQAKETAA